MLLTFLFVFVGWRNLEGIRNIIYYYRNNRIIPLVCRNSSAALNQESKVAKILRGKGVTEIGKTLVAALYQYFHATGNLRELKCRVLFLPAQWPNVLVS